MKCKLTRLVIILDFASEFSFIKVHWYGVVPTWRWCSRFWCQIYSLNKVSMFNTYSFTMVGQNTKIHSFYHVCFLRMKWYDCSFYFCDYALILLVQNLAAFFLIYFEWRAHKKKTQIFLPRKYIPCQNILTNLGLFWVSMAGLLASGKLWLVQTKYSNIFNWSQSQNKLKTSRIKRLTRNSTTVNCFSYKISNLLTVAVYSQQCWLNISWLKLPWSVSHFILTRKRTVLQVNENRIVWKNKFSYIRKTKFFTNYFQIRFHWPKKKQSTIFSRNDFCYFGKITWKQSLIFVESKKNYQKISPICC